MATISTHEMMYELEVDFGVKLPNGTPPDTVAGLWQCAKIASDETIPIKWRKTAEYLFSLFERGNEDAMDEIAGFQKLYNIGAIAYWDEMGVPADEMLDD